MLVIAGVMSFGVVLVGVISFFPTYFVSFSAAERATRLVHLQSINVVRSATKSSAMHLPTLINTISVNYVISLKNRKNFFPKDKQKLLFALANVMSKKAHRDAVGSLLVVSAEPPGEEWGAMAVSFFETHQIGGCVMHGMDSSIIYEIDPNRANFTVPYHRLVTDDVNLVQKLHQSAGPYESIVVPWNKSKIQGAQWNKYWLTAGIGYSFMYFDYVLPFITNKGLGFWEIAMRTSVFDHGALGLLARTLRDNGRFMLFDSTIEFVVLNSWGQKTITKETNGSHSVARVLRLNSISDPLMKATVKRMRQHGGLEAFLKGSDRGELSFRYNDDEVYARLLRLKDDSGLNLFMLISTLHADFFRAIYQSSTHVGLATGISVFVVAIFAVIIAYFLVRPLRRLVPELKRASQLQLRGQNDKSDVWKRSRIAEVRNIQNAYAELTRQLRIVKTFVPSAILAAPSTSTSSNSFNSRDHLCHRKARGHHPHATFTQRDDPIAARAELEAMEENNFAKLRQEMRINSRVFKEQTNKFVRRYCTVVLIENARPFSLDAYFHNILTCAAEQNGCVEYSRPDRTLVSFGAHSPLPMHSIKGCRFALDLFAKLAPQERESITIFIDTNEFHVGTCGAQSKNARVVVGVMNLRELAKVANRLGCRIAVTAGTSSQLQGHQVYPIECVLPSSSSESVVLSELRPQTALRQTMVGTAKHFRLGFSAMRQGNYKQAISHFQRVERSDPQAQRLIRLCAQRRSQNDNKSYVRLAIEILQEKLPDVNVTAADDAVFMNSVDCSQDACGKIVLNKSGVFSMQAKASPKRKGCESEGGALFEMINFSNSSSSESLQAFEDGFNSADDLPLLLTDMNHRVWTRSLKKLARAHSARCFLECRRMVDRWPSSVSRGGVATLCRNPWRRK
ncbi:MAP protein kinase, putative [Trypanosoma cruzi marinkellei]|uniref:MAP protein kinase, putative n=1 Tax=Trypanosoma cruzi marinkellei TaxID=85056 RepID=K2MVE0_TRYCR|nr:MAP protein kinase, putative [Trypanosoma cruzi marinkellei]